MAKFYARGMALGLALAPADGATMALPVPFAQAALWAAELPALRLCDFGVDDRQEDRLMQMPIVAQLAVACLQVDVLVELRPYLEIEPPVILSVPMVPSRPRWPWPSDGRTSLGQATFTLRTGARMPAIGFGTWRLWAKDAYQPVRWALEAGYRHLDTAEGYANEAEIGKAILDSGIPREEIFIATKASSIPKGLTDIAHAAEVFAFQLGQLGTYVDLYMLHTCPQDPAHLQALWEIMERFYEEGRARALGVSNCDVKELQFILGFARIPPAYVQNLFKIYKPGEQIFTDDVVAFAHANQMVFMGYSVQTEWPHVMSPLEDPHVLAIATSVGRTPSQVLHRWALQRGVGVIPKSATYTRIHENAKLLNFELNEAALRLLDGLATLTFSDSVESPLWLGLTLCHGQMAWVILGLGATSAKSEVEPPISATIGPGDALNKGFPYTAIRDHILSTSPSGPEDCRQKCLGDQRCLLEFSDNAHYEGEFRFGLYDGRGRFEWPGGSFYHGDWSKGAMHGRGVLCFSSSAGLTESFVYVGDFAHGEIQGCGCVKLPQADGVMDEYQGEFESSDCRGYGIFTSASLRVAARFEADGEVGEKAIPGQVYCGQMQRGIEHGEGCMQVGDKYIAGSWCEGKRKSWLEETSVDPASSTRVFSILREEGVSVAASQQHDGVALTMLPSGDSYAGFVENGKKHGRGMYVYRDQSAFKGEWVKDALDGVEHPRPQSKEIAEVPGELEPSKPEAPGPEVEEVKPPEVG
eukprot:s1169_g16.t2